MLIVAVFAVFGAIWFHPASGDFKADNTGWNGISSFIEKSGATVVYSFSELPSEKTRSVLICIPYTPISPGELDQIHDYVVKGGTLILMDDYGYGNELLEALDVGHRFPEGPLPLLDPMINYKNVNFPRISNFATSPLTDGIDELVFDHSSSLVNTKDNEVVAWSSSFSFLDENGNSIHDVEVEARGPFPVIAHTLLGDGNVITISDPSIIINSLIEIEDNYTIIENAFQLRTEYPKVYVAQQLLPDSNLHETQGVLRTARDTLAHPAVVFGMVGAVLLLAFQPLWRIRR
jgi:hypothetical protein